MADLERSNAQWLAFFDRFNLGVRLGRRLLEQRDFWGEEREQVYDYDPLGNTSAFVLTGAKYRTNTDPAGKIYVRFVANVGNWDVTLYKATGGSSGDAVASATDVADGATATLAESNSSGLSGSCLLDASVTADATDGHYVRPYLDARVDGERLFDGTETITDDDSRSLQSWYAYCDRQKARAEAALDDLASWFVDFLISDPDRGNQVAFGAEWLDSDQTVLISDQGEEDGSGAISRLRRGVLEDLRQAMVDETTGSTQTIVQRVLSGAAAVAGTSNDGTGAIAIHVPEDQCDLGDYTLRCVEGKGNDNGGVEKFEVTFKSSEDDSVRTLPDLLTIKQAYRGDNGFGGTSGITLLRTRSKTGDASHLNLSTVTGGTWSESGETETNTDGGILYWKIEANASNWDISFYKSSTRTSTYLVAKATNIATDGTFAATQQNASGLTVNGTIGSGPTTATEGTVDLNFHSIQNSAGKPDSYKITVTQTSSGVGARLIAKLLNYKLNGTTAGSETIDDDVYDANFQEPFAVIDN